MNTKTLTFKNAEGRLFSVQLSCANDNFMDSMVEFFDISDEQSEPYPIGISCGVDLLLTTQFEAGSPASVLHQDNLPMWGIVDTTLEEITTWIKSHQSTDMEHQPQPQNANDFNQTLKQAQQSIYQLETQLTHLKQLSPKQQNKMIVHLLSAKKHLLKAELLL